MKDALSEAFTNYTELVRATLGDRRAFDERLRATGILTLQPEKRVEFLPYVVERLESLEPFHQLLKETQSALPDTYCDRDSAWTIEWVDGAVRNFFRRSDFYLDVFEGDTVSLDKACEMYKEALKKQEIQARSLILLNGVEFASSISCIQFDTFQIQRFSTDELEKILRNRINRVFYQHAVIDAGQLQDYWFVSTTDTQPRPDPSSLDLSNVGNIDPPYKRLTEEFPLGSPQQILILLPWEKWDQNWHGYHHACCPGRHEPQSRM